MNAKEDKMKSQSAPFGALIFHRGDKPPPLEYLGLPVSPEFHKV